MHLASVILAILMTVLFPPSAVGYFIARYHLQGETNGRMLPFDVRRKFHAARKNAGIAVLITLATAFSFWMIALNVSAFGSSLVGGVIFGFVTLLAAIQVYLWVAELLEASKLLRSHDTQKDAGLVPTNSLEMR